MARHKQKLRPSEKLFADAQKDLFEKSYQERLEAEKNKPVECLGITFQNDDERRQYFLEKLRKNLEDPEFRKIEGFPIGSDEDILALSDPPYYTACPNPFIADFIKYYGKPYDPTKPYRREPFAADVSEGKNDPIYNAHSYHTKVPHKAIMRYILHYTEPGDMVFDGFCGTGMTGVAAQLCGDKEALADLGYALEVNGQIKDKNGNIISRLGSRKSALGDLSPIATFISNNYRGATERLIQQFESESKRILNEIEYELGDLFSVVIDKGSKKGTLKYSVWSDVFYCPNCGGELCYWDIAVNTSKWSLKKKYPVLLVMLSSEEANSIVLGYRIMIRFAMNQ